MQTAIQTMIDNVRAVNSGTMYGDEYLWRIYQRGWLLFFYPPKHSPTSYVWAKTSAQAIDRFLFGKVER